jgi:hypothetical protein
MADALNMGQFWKYFQFEMYLKSYWLVGQHEDFILSKSKLWRMLSANLKHLMLTYVHKYVLTTYTYTKNWLFSFIKQYFLRGRSAKGQVFSKRTPQIHIRKFKEQTPWGPVPCCESFLTSRGSSGLLWTLWMSEMQATCP